MVAEDALSRAPDNLAFGDVSLQGVWYEYACLPFGFCPYSVLYLDETLLADS